MAKRKTSVGIMVSILLGAVIVSGALVFLGIQISRNGSDENFDKAIEKGIEKYVEKKQKEYEDAQKRVVAPVVEGDLSDDDAVLGNAEAPVTIVEFSDYQCPYCVKFWSETFSDIEKNYIATGKVKFVYRDWPLTEKHPRAIPAALAAECVSDQLGDDGYYEMHDLLFGSEGDLSDDNLTKFAVEAGVDESEFLDCYESQKFLGEVEKDFNDGIEYGVSGTPTFFVNGMRIVGTLPYEDFAMAIEDALDKEGL